MLFSNWSIAVIHRKNRYCMNRTLILEESEKQSNFLICLTAVCLHFQWLFFFFKLSDSYSMIMLLRSFSPPTMRNRQSSLTLDGFFQTFKNNLSWKTNFSLLRVFSDIYFCPPHSCIEWPTSPDWRQSSRKHRHNEREEDGWWPLLVLFRWALIYALARAWNRMENCSLPLWVACHFSISVCCFASSHVLAPQCCCQSSWFRYFSVHIMAYLCCRYSWFLITVIKLMHGGEKRWHMQSKLMLTVGLLYCNLLRNSTNTESTLLKMYFKYVGNGWELACNTLSCEPYPSLKSINIIK